MWSAPRGITMTVEKEAKGEFAHFSRDLKEGLKANEPVPEEEPLTHIVYSDEKLMDELISWLEVVFNAGVEVTIKALDKRLVQQTEVLRRQ